MYGTTVWGGGRRVVGTSGALVLENWVHIS